MSKVDKVLKKLTKLGLTIEDVINHTIYEYEGNLIVFFDCDGEEQYKGIIVFSDVKEKIGEVDWYYFDDISMKEYMVIKDNL